MKQVSNPPSLDPNVDLELARIVEQLADRALSGGRFNLDEFIAEHPEHGEQIRRLLPAMQLLANAEVSGSDDGRAVPPDQAEMCRGLLGDFRILREIGRGGMGVVYEAEQLSLGRSVALKVLPFAAVLAEKTIKRFKNEARAAASLDHPHIVPVHAVGSDRGVHYYAMTLIEGLTLAQVIAALRVQAASGDRRQSSALSIDQIVSNKNRLDSDYSHDQPIGDLGGQVARPDRVFRSKSADTKREIQAGVPTKRSLRDNALFRRFAEIGIHAADALHHAHERGVVHRDVKPANLMIDTGGKLWVADFGLAQIESDPGMTMTGDLVGTIRYMSPEQALCKRVVVDHRTDIYSLGVTLYELLTLAPAFTGEDRQELMRKIAFEEPRSPLNVNKTIPADLGTIVLKAMEKNPHDRYQTAEELAADLRSWLADEAIKARPPNLLQRALKWARRNRPAVAALAAALVSIVIAAASFGWWQIRQESRILQHQIESARRVAAAEQAAKQTEKKLRLKAEASELEAKHRLYDADLRGGISDWTTGNVTRLFENLLRHLPESGMDDLRGWEWYYLLSLTQQHARLLGTHRYQIVDWSSDGRKLASASREGTVQVYDCETWRAVRTWHGAPVCTACWSPNGQHLAWGTVSLDSAVYVQQMDTGEIRCFRGHTGSVWTVAWSPDGTRLASAGMDQSILIWDTATGEQLQKINGHASIKSVRWHPGGILLASWGEDNLLRICDSVSGEIVRQTHGANGPICWSPAGEELAVGTADGQCRIYRSADLSLASAWQAHRGAIVCIEWDATGNRIATAGGDHLLQVWDRPSAANVETLRVQAATGSSITWEPHGRRLATAGGVGVQIWELPLSVQPRCLEGHSGEILAMTWSKDSHTLKSYGGVDGRIATWDVETGACLETVSVSAGRLGQFNLTGEELAITPNKNEPQNLLLCDARSGELTRIVKFSGWPVTGEPVSMAREASKMVNVVTPRGPTLEIIDLIESQSQCQLTGPEYPHACSWAPNEQFLAVAGLGEFQVLDCEKAKCILQLPRAQSASAWSPDGKRLAVGSPHGRIEVWDIPTVRLIVTENNHSAAVQSLAWSQDGRRVASGSEDRTVSVWDPFRGVELLRLDVPRGAIGQLEWSPDGHRLAAGLASGEIYIWDASRGYQFVESELYFTQLVDIQVGQVTRLLAAGNQDQGWVRYEEILHMCRDRLGADHPQTLLVMHRLAREYWSANQRQKATALWDQTIESGKGTDLLFSLAEDLDEHAKSVIEDGRNEDAIALYEVAIRMYADHVSASGGLAALLLGRDPKRGLQLMENAVRIGPHYIPPAVLNNYAWLLATSPEPSLRNSALAVEFAKLAVEQDPSDATIVNTLGVAQYRFGDWQATLTSLMKSVEMRQGGDSFDGFFLAMAHAQLGHAQEAREWYDRAVEWMDKNQPQNEELLRFRAEAAGLLEVKQEANPDIRLKTPEDLSL